MKKIRFVREPAGRKAIRRTLAIRLAYSVFLCRDHTKIPGDATFQNNLLNVLLTQETTEDRIVRSLDETELP